MSARTTSRRKPARPAAATELAKFPDPRTIEPRQAFDDELADDPLGTAQELAYDALDTVDARSRYALARRALAVSPLCADAWLVLAERPANAAHHRRALLERAVAAGERALGPGGVEAFDGPFWLAFKTRPYMRARHALAEDLWVAGERM